MHIDNEPARTDMTQEEFDRHLAQTVIIEVHEPRLPLSQGSWLRASRQNVSATINTVILAAPGNVRLTVRDSVTAASLRRR